MGILVDKSDNVWHKIIMKTTKRTFRIEPEIDKALKKQAKKELRSVSNLIQFLIKMYLIKKETK